MRRILHRGMWTTLFCFVVAGIAVVLSLFSGSNHNHAAEESPEVSSASLKVDVVRPTAGGVNRVTVQPGSIHAYQSAELFAKLSGFLKVLKVDIGDHVHVGDHLAEIEAPELQREVDRSVAAVHRARTQVLQMESRVTSAEAQRKFAEASVERAHAAIKRDTAALSFREKQLNRMRELAKLKSIDERLVDEKEDLYLAAQSAVDASRAAVNEAVAQVATATAKIGEAQADLADAKAEVEVAEAIQEKAQVSVDYTKIISPYDGVITQRGFHRGDFIRPADQGGHAPIVTVERIDLFRVVVAVPDRDIPFTDPGDDAIVELDALPGQQFRGKVSRLSYSEDPRTRTMRTEIDLPNTSGRLRIGMYGRVTIQLQKGEKNAFTIPSDCISGSVKNGNGTVFVVRNGRARKTEVRLGNDDGVHVEVLSGLTANDLVISGNNAAVHDGGAVQVNETAREQASH